MMRPKIPTSPFAINKVQVRREEICVCVGSGRVAVAGIKEKGESEGRRASERATDKCRVENLAAKPANFLHAL